MDVVRDLQTTLSPPVVRQIAQLVHASVRGTTDVVGAGVDGALATLAAVVGRAGTRDEHDALLAALNCVVGDRLAAEGSPLAIPMSLRPPLDERRQGTLLVLVHGAAMSDRGWRRQTAEGTHDHGRALLEDLEHDVTLLYAHYNSGLHVKDNGAALAAALASASEGFARVVLVGYSMGGLVARGAIAVAEREGQAWRDRLALLVTLSAPHHGSHLERAGHVVDRLLAATPWTAPLARLGKIRSAGITDLRYGAVVDADRDRFAARGARPQPVPLPDGVHSVAIAATRSPPDADAFTDDNLVPVDSALGRSPDLARALAFDETHVVTETDHLQILQSAAAYAHLRAACERALADQ